MVVRRAFAGRDTLDAHGDRAVLRAGKILRRRGDVEPPGRHVGNSPGEREGGGAGKLGREAQRLVDLMWEGEGLAR